ncbi:hypothetical protein A2U01_0070306, partial [Trifolium medium]|nr:hypothetical protein [Trifolium medium]
MGRCGAASARVHSASARFLRAGGSLGPGAPRNVDSNDNWKS